MTLTRNQLGNNRKEGKFKSCKYRIFKFTYKIVSALLLQVLTSQLEWNEHFCWGTICKYNGNKTLQAVSKIFHQNFTKRIPPAIEKPVAKKKKKQLCIWSTTGEATKFRLKDLKKKELKSMWVRGTQNLKHLGDIL